MKKKTAFTFNLGASILKTTDINELREYVDEIRQAAEETGSDFSGTLGDFLFSVESAYREWHGLNEDNFELVH